MADKRRPTTRTNEPTAKAPVKGDGTRISAAQNRAEKVKKHRAPEQKSELGEPPRKGRGAASDE